MSSKAEEEAIAAPEIAALAPRSRYVGSCETSLGQEPFS
jgi:hypothetical protein